MDVRQHLNQFYLDNVIRELYLYNNGKYENISYNSLLYLDIIAYTPDCTVSYLANVLHIAKSAVTQKVNELESKNMVYKRQSTTDRRVFYLEINREVLNDYREYNQPLNDGIAELKNNYTKEEIAGFCRMLDDLRKYIAVPGAKPAKDGIY